MTTHLLQAAGDGLTIANRNLTKIRRVPEVLVGALVQPLLMILVFGFVFGGAIVLPGDASYREFLIGGIFSLTLTFGASFTAAGLADDLAKGVMDRFRSLPMARIGVLLGRTGSDLVLSVISIAVMAGAGLLAGWRIRNGLGNAVAGLGLLLFYAYVLSWVMAYVGLRVRSVEIVNNAALIVIFPLTFVANTVVPGTTLPAGLRPIADWNPVSAITQATRELFGNIPPETPSPDAWPLQHPILYTLGWGIIALSIFMPLSVRIFTRTGRS